MGNYLCSQGFPPFLTFGLTQCQKLSACKTTSTFIRVLFIGSKDTQRYFWNIIYAFLICVFNLYVFLLMFRFSSSVVNSYVSKEKIILFYEIILRLLYIVGVFR